MISLQLLLALAITCAPAWVWLERLVPANSVSRRLLIGGYALLLGMIGIPLIMRLLSIAGIPFSLVSIGAVAAVIFLAGIVAPANWRTPAMVPPPYPTVTSPLTLAQKLFIGLCLALILSRLIALGLEAGTRPVFAWDAKQHWAKQAKVFYELRAIASYVSLQEWLTLDGQNVYTTIHPDYAITVPLLQTWVSVALGQWHDSLINLPWVLIWLALGLVFYSQARQAGIGTTTSLAATYMALSLPYLNTQVALAGYADVLLALCFLAALTAFYNWSRGRDRWQALLFVVSASCCLLVKNEGFFWFLAFTPGLVLAFFGIRRGLLVAGLLLLALVLTIWLMPEDWVVAGHTLQEISLQYRPESWPGIYLSFLVHDNWHFLGYLLLVALLAALWRSKTLTSNLLPAAAVVVATLILFLCLYLLTRNSFGAVHLTSLNRVALQLMPAAAFFVLLVYASLASEIQSDGRHHPPPTAL
jgi:hypothetical protein